MPKKAKADLKITKGSVMIYYCFDIANDIDIDHIETIFGKRPEKKSIVVERITPSYVQYTKPPLLVRLGQKSVGKWNFNLEAKLCDFGVVTIRLWMPVKGSIKDLKKLSSKLINNKDLEKIAKDEVKRIRNEIKPV